MGPEYVFMRSYDAVALKELSKPLSLERNPDLNRYEKIPMLLVILSTGKCCVRFEGSSTVSTKEGHEVFDPDLKFSLQACEFHPELW